jgi:hypothetical protein
MKIPITRIGIPQKRGTRIPRKRESPNKKTPSIIIKPPVRVLLRVFI